MPGGVRARYRGTWWRRREIYRGGFLDGYVCAGSQGHPLISSTEYVLALLCSFLRAWRGVAGGPCRPCSFFGRRSTGKETIELLTVPPLHVRACFGGWWQIAVANSCRGSRLNSPTLSGVCAGWCSWRNQLRTVVKALTGCDAGFRDKPFTI